MKIRDFSEISAAGGRRQLNGLTLIEVLGALAVIAILAVSLAGPTINTINEMKAMNAVGSYQSLITAATNHFAACGSFDSYFTVPGTVIPIPDPPGTMRINWDTSVLIPEGLLTSPFKIKVGSAYPGPVVQVVQGQQANGGNGYLLDGMHNFTSGKAWVVEIVVSGVSPQNAFDISQIVDSVNNTPATAGLPDNKGKITYDGSSIMHMYVASY